MMVPQTVHSRFMETRRGTRQRVLPYGVSGVELLHEGFPMPVLSGREMSLVTSWFMQSRGVKCHPWRPLMPLQVSLRFLVHFEEH